jgi:hypothetical protein
VNPYTWSKAWKGVMYYKYLEGWDVLNRSAKPMKRVMYSFITAQDR